MLIQVIGIGCESCRRMEAYVRAIVIALGLDAKVERVDSIEEILQFGLFSLPGLAVNGRVITTGYRGRERTEQLIREAVEQLEGGVQE